MMFRSRRLRKTENRLHSAEDKINDLRKQVATQRHLVEEIGMALRTQRSFMETEITNVLTYLEQSLANQALSISSHWADQLQQRGDAIQQALNTHWADQLQQRGDAIQQALIKEMLRQRNDVDAVIKTLLSRLSSSINRQEADNIPTQSSRINVEPLFYTYFEDEFRGSRELITDRQKELVRAVVSFSGAPGRWLDVGCGRGELLGILKDSGVKSLGLEPNEYFVSECRSRGLEVIHGSTAHLESVDLGGHFDVVSMMQVAEHLDIEELVASIRQISNRLTPNGLLILEFPNICNPSVMVADFWLDPTHLRPLHPRLVEFVLTNSGLPPITHHDATELGRLLWSPSDAARGPDALIIGQKP